MDLRDIRTGRISLQELGRPGHSEIIFKIGQAIVVSVKAAVVSERIQALRDFIIVWNAIIVIIIVSIVTEAISIGID